MEYNLRIEMDSEAYKYKITSMQRRESESDQWEDLTNQWEDLLASEVTFSYPLEDSLDGGLKQTIIDGGGSIAEGISRIENGLKRFK